MATKKAAQKKIIEPVEQKPRVAEFFRFGESYTSLILGIIAVIIATVLLLSFVHNRQTTKLDQQTPETIHVTDEVPLTPGKVTPTDSQILTAVSTVRSTNTPQPTEVVSQAPTPTSAPETTTITGKTYTVAAGDSLWTIAEKTYNDGDKWVAIARANHLSHPSQIHAGNKLVLPTVEVNQTESRQAAPTTAIKPMQQTDHDGKITGETYKVQPGDSLSTIAKRAYGDADAWTKIAEANKLVNPSIIHVGNVLTLPGK